MNKEDIDCVNFNNFSCLIFTGTCLASEPSRSAVFYCNRKSKIMHNMTIILDIDYRPYTWTSSQRGIRSLYAVLQKIVIF